MQEKMKHITYRLKIEEISELDIIEIHKLYSLNEIKEFLTEAPSSLKETKEYLQKYMEDQKNDKRKNYYWTIRDKNDSTFIGIVGMNIFAERFRLAKIFFYLRPEFWGNGYATESVKTIINFGFVNLSLHRIEAGADIENEKSLKVLEKCQMKREGIRRKLLPIQDNWKDCFHYAILETDLRNY